MGAIIGNKSYIIKWEQKKAVTKLEKAVTIVVQRVLFIA